MKKLFLFAALALTTLTAPAQNLGQLTNLSNSTGKPDTITNAATTYLNTRLVNPGYVAIQLDVKKVSGTVAGYAFLQASVDNEYTPKMWATVPTTDTFTLTDGDNSKIWRIPSDYLHYRVKVVTTGTQKNVPTAWYLYRKL